MNATITTPPESQTPPPPMPADKPNGKSDMPAEVTAAVARDALAEIEALRKREAQVKTVARLIDRENRAIEKQMTAVAEAESSLKAERASLHKLEHHRDELQQELNLLALGKNSERLPFPPPAETKEAKAQAPAEQAQWRSVRLADLTPRISNRTLKALAEHNPPLLTLGELSDWQKAKGDFWAKDIGGIGDKGRDEIETAQLAYWREHPELTLGDPKSVGAADAKVAALDLQRAASAGALPDPTPRDETGKPKRFKGNHKAARK
jgi:hypothetical protein